MSKEIPLYKGKSWFIQNLDKFEIFIKFSLIKSSEVILLFLNFANILENKGVISFKIFTSTIFESSTSNSFSKNASLTTLLIEFSTLSK